MTMHCEGCSKKMGRNIPRDLAVIGMNNYATSSISGRN